MKSLQYIGAMFKKNAELTYDALAIHLHNKLSNHTINMWKKFCVHYGGMIEDLRNRAISNAEKKATYKDQSTTVAIGTETTGADLHVTQEATSQQVNFQQTGPQQPILAQAAPQPNHSPTSEPTIPKQNIPQPVILQQGNHQPTIPQEAGPQPVIPQRVTQTTTPQQVNLQPPTLRQMTPQQTMPQQATFERTTTLHERQPPENISGTRSIVVKTEPMDEDDLDFAFATEVLSAWKPNEENDAALWKRMDNMRPSATAPSWEAFCTKHWSRFDHFFSRTARVGATLAS